MPVYRPIPPSLATAASLISAFLALTLLAATGFRAPALHRLEEQTNASSLRSYAGTTLSGQRAAPAETLSYVVQSGEVLIFNLPTSFGTRRMERYRLKKAPALSWLVDRSYFWRTLSKDVGEHTLIFEATTTGSTVEEIYVVVDVL
jgi:hypothetical protein